MSPCCHMGLMKFMHLTGFLITDHPQMRAALSYTGLLKRNCFKKKRERE